VSWAWWDWPLTWLTNHHPSVLWHCWLGHVTRKTVSEMTHNVSSGTLNTTTPYQWSFVHRTHCHSFEGTRFVTRWFSYILTSVNNIIIITLLILSTKQLALYKQLAWLHNATMSLFLWLWFNNGTPHNAQTLSEKLPHEEYHLAEQCLGHKVTNSRNVKIVSSTICLRIMHRLM